MKHSPKLRTCMPVIPLVPSDSPTLISSLLRLSAHHLALAASALQPLNCGTLSLLSLRTCTSPDTFRRHLKTHYCQQAFRQLSTSPLTPHNRLLLTTVRMKNLYFTYLLEIHVTVDRWFITVIVKLCLHHDSVISNSADACHNLIYLQRFNKGSSFARMV